MTENFGEILMKVKNVSSFAEKIKTKIGAKNWHLNKINYTNFKAFAMNHFVNDISMKSTQI